MLLWVTVYPANCTTTMTSNDSVEPSAEISSTEQNKSSLVPSANISVTATRNPMLPDKKEKLVEKLNALVCKLEKCCECSNTGEQPPDDPFDPSPKVCVPQDFRTPGWRCPKKPCTPTGPVKYGLAPRPPFKDIPLGGRRSVPFEVDWENYPLITTCATRETRFKSNKADISEAERTRRDLRICMRPWLPQPTDLGGDGTAWDLRRYPSRELIESNLIIGCECRKTNGIQDRCPRKDCRGSPACIHEPYPVCKPSGGPGPAALCPQDLTVNKRHKNNCWCPECRPACFPKRSERELNGRCAGCVGRDEPICGSKCEHYCNRHMAGVKQTQVPPIMC